MHMSNESNVATYLSNSKVQKLLAKIFVTKYCHYKSVFERHSAKPHTTGPTSLVFINVIKITVIHKQL